MAAGVSYAYELADALGMTIDKTSKSKLRGQVVRNLKIEGGVSIPFDLNIVSSSILDNSMSAIAKGPGNLALYALADRNTAKGDIGTKLYLLDLAKLEMKLSEVIPDKENVSPSTVLKRLAPGIIRSYAKNYGTMRWEIIP